MSQVIARWSIEMWCTCPHCEYYIQIDKEIKDSFEWMGAPGQSRKNVDQAITCPICAKEIVIDEIEYS